ncbi:MAG TPA: hypothetical protein VNO21_12655 [Polyangiaceae bacterium]|nr:hypothetical protein [Polyangiaceae bacterium]
MRSALGPCGRLAVKRASCTRSYRILRGDLRSAETLAQLESNSFDALLSDPPYGLSPDGKARTWDDISAERGRGGFMGQAWDAAVPGPTFWREMLRVLKPGAPLLVFGSTRTYHRLAGAIEDAGFEIIDTLEWIHGQGFPKSLDIPKALKRSRRARAGRLAATWTGYGTALKPAHEPIVVAQKPRAGTYVQNVERWGVGGFAIDACRVHSDWSERSESWKRSGHSAKPTAQKIAAPPGVGIQCHRLGRWPANLVLDEEAGAVLDAQSGPLTSGARTGRRRAPKTKNTYGAFARRNEAPAEGDAGGASRFFYCAKASRWERELGCEHLPLRSAGEMTGGRKDGAAALNCPCTGAGRNHGARNHHTTLKPIRLTTWLASLVLPPPRADLPRRLLVPFAGAASEMIGALSAGWDECVGIESGEDYVAIAEARLRRWLEAPPPTLLRDRRRSTRAASPRGGQPSSSNQPSVNERQISLFGRTA